MDERREALIGATADVLSEYDDAFEVATRLNRIYAPFNVYDREGRRSNHLVVGAQSEKKLLFEFYDRHGEDRMDAREVVRAADGVWWFADKELSKEPGDYLHSTVAYSCLSLVPWANEEMIAQAAGAMD
jgi:hypothetical protein